MNEKMSEIENKTKIKVLKTNYKPRNHVLIANGIRVILRGSAFKFITENISADI